MQQPSLILLFGADHRLVETRRWVMESSGYRVYTSMTLVDLATISADEPIALFLLCDSLRPQIRRLGIALIQARWPAARRLVMAPTIFTNEQIYDGDVVSASQGPGELLATIDRLLSRPGPTAGNERSTNYL